MSCAVVKDNAPAPPSGGACPVRSPLPWIGGKYYSRARIIAAFPDPSRYEVYCEPFCGACHVLLSKPRAGHAEVINDLNADLVNWWLACRNHPNELRTALELLPYSRTLYHAYHASLFDGTPLNPVERAARWFYAVRSSFRAAADPQSTGWDCAVDPRHNPAVTFQNMLAIFEQIATRLRTVHIDARNYDAVITQYSRRSTLFYVDPPYIGKESYYKTGARFTTDDHRRLADLLNQTSAFVALSYYEHPLLEALYPASRWRRVRWSSFKHLQRTCETHEQTAEVLLCNYDPPGYEATPPEPTRSPSPVATPTPGSTPIPTPAVTRLDDLSIIALYQHCKARPLAEQAALWTLVRELRSISVYENGDGPPFETAPHAWIRALLRSDIAWIEANHDHAY